MGSDKRNVSTDALETLGTIITENEKRDAIHLAVIPIAAGETLKAGLHVRIGEDGRAYFKESKAAGKPLIGIVDPFLGNIVGEGQIFWLVIYPRKITSLRHVWTHPDLPDVTDVPVIDKAASEQWLKDFVESHGGDSGDFRDLISLAERHDGGTSLHTGNLMGGMQGSIPPEFWEHIQNLTGSKILLSDRAEYFSCAC